MLASRVARASAKGRSYESELGGDGVCDSKFATKLLTSSRFEAASLDPVEPCFIGHMRARNDLGRSGSDPLAENQMECWGMLNRSLGLKIKCLRWKRTQLHSFFFPAQAALL